MFRLIIFLLLGIAPALHAEPVVINAVGDIMLSGSGERTFKTAGYDHAFKATVEILRQGDLVIGNLESPIATSGTEFVNKKFRFKAAPPAAAALKSAGFTHVSLANNHIMDFGAEGLQQTISALDSSGIIHAGAGNNLAAARTARHMTVKGTRIAFLSYSLTYPEEFFAGAERPGTAAGYAAYFREDIRTAKEGADCVIVSFHWGAEGRTEPKPYQIKTAHQAIDAGADIVIGHHPHVIQGVEYYRDGVILYSLGNFAFGSFSKSSDRSIIARITFDGSITEVEIIPINVLNSQVRFQPRLLQGIAARQTAEKLDRLSQGLGTTVSLFNDRYLATPDTRVIAMTP